MDMLKLFVKASAAVYVAQNSSRDFLAVAEIISQLRARSPKTPNDASKAFYSFTMWSSSGSGWSQFG